jgi:hypothetical protein
LTKVTFVSAARPVGCRAVRVDSSAMPSTGPPPTVRPAWRSLPPRAKAFRIAHVAWGVVAVSALVHVWASAMLRRRDPSVWASVAFLLIQGIALVAGRGDCPFGPYQRRLGDPVPMFELVLPPRAAKAAIPILAVVAMAGIVALFRRPSRVRSGSARRQVGG